MPSPDARDFALTLVCKAEQDELVLAKLLDDPRVADEVLGFHVQQAVEKRLKAVLALNEIQFRQTHSIGYLTTLLEQNNVELPSCRAQIETLTPWAGDARYEDFFEGSLDRPVVPGLVAAVAEWSNELVGVTHWVSATGRLLKSFAKHGAYDHVALLVEREREAFVVHVTLDGSAWIGSVDELGVAVVVQALDQEDREVVSLASDVPPKTIADGLALVAGETLEWANAKQVLLLVRTLSDYSFMWWHATPERTLTGDGSVR